MSIKLNWPFKDFASATFQNLTVHVVKAEVDDCPTVFLRVICDDEGQRQRFLSALTWDDPNGDGSTQETVPDAGGNLGAEGVTAEPKKPWEEGSQHKTREMVPYADRLMLFREPPCCETPFGDCGCVVVSVTILLKNGIVGSDQGPGTYGYHYTLKPCALHSNAKELRDALTEAQALLTAIREGYPEIARDTRVSKVLRACGAALESTGVQP